VSTRIPFTLDGTDAAQTLKHLRHVRRLNQNYHRISSFIYTEYYGNLQLYRAHIKAI